MDAPEELRQAIAAVVLAELDREVPCSCIPAYKDRGLADPQCTYCDVLGGEEMIAGAVLAVPAIADALAAARTCERDMARLVEERDEAQEWADRLAACAGGPEVIGEHSNVNNPWANALDLLRRDGR